MNLRQSTLFLALCCSVFLVSCGKESPTPESVTPPVVTDTLPVINTPLTPPGKPDIVPPMPGMVPPPANSMEKTGENTPPVSTSTGSVAPAVSLLPPPSESKPTDISPLPSPVSSGSIQPVTPTPPIPPTPPAPVSSTNKTISFTETYKTPAGTDEATFSFVVDATNTIQGITVTTPASTNPVSTKYIAGFDTNIRAKIVGVKVADLTNLDTLGGSSLTPVAYNTALSRLKK